MTYSIIINNHKSNIEEDYMNDLKGDVVKSTAKRGALKKK